MNAINFLIHEHDKVRKMLAHIENVSQQHETKRKLFKNLCHELLVHETVEEEKWYPHFKKQLNDEVKHLVQEEKHAAKEIKKFADIVDPKLWQDKFLKFKKAVEQHAEEEEKKLFPEVKKLLSDTQLIKIGKELKEYKNQLMDKSNQDEITI